MNQDISEIIKKLEEHEKRISSLENRETLHEEKIIAPKEGQIRLKDYLEKATSDVQRTLAIAYHLKRGGHEIFNAGDLEIAFEKAHERKPSNINDKINMNVNNKHMEKSSSKKDTFKAWYVTKDGERFVENSFKLSKN